MPLADIEKYIVQTGEYVGHTVEKYLGKDLFTGRVTHFDADNGLYHVLYSDGDEEDMELSERVLYLPDALREEGT